MVNMINMYSNINKVNLDNVFFQGAIKNTVIDNSIFIRIIYSNEMFSMNGIFVDIPITITNTERYYNKYKCIFDVNKNMDEITKIISLEKSLLQKLNIQNKIMKFNISEQLKTGHIKLFSSDSVHPGNKIILKISGVWENNIEFGLTFKFSSVNHLF